MTHATSDATAMPAADADLSLAAIDAAAATLAPHLPVTPVWTLQGPGVVARLGAGTTLVAKLELLQRTGSFKARGALLNVLALDTAARQRGICAISAGNHAIAAAWAASVAGVPAHIVMIATANPFRIEQCRAYGATVELAADAHRGFARVEELRAQGLALVHPFEGRLTALGSATLGREFLRQAPDLDAVIVPIGGGGLAAGVATAVKRIAPRCRVYGVEPTGADSMHRSFAAGRPMPIDRVATIADSLGAPFALPYSFALCRAAIDELVLVDDAAMIDGMRFLLEHGKLAVEPAGASATAALLGPLREKLAGHRVGVIVCGANIDAASYARLIG